LRFLASANLSESMMQKREVTGATIAVANNRDISGWATADKICHGFRTAKSGKLLRSTFLGSLIMAGLFIVLVPIPGRGENDKDKHPGREDNERHPGHDDNDKATRVEIA